ncbi:MAG: glycosyltransferase family 4 protein [Xenococcaceae cyanobacterium]
MSKKIYFDLSTLANTFAGSAVYCWEVCHRLMRRSQTLEVIPVSCPFSTVGKKGLARTINALLRDLVWNNILFGIEANPEDYFIFPNIVAHRRFYRRKYAIVVHDIGAWHNPEYLSWRGKFTMRRLPIAVKNADRVFAVSNFTANDIAKEFDIPREKIIIAPNGLSEVFKKTAPLPDKINGISLKNIPYFLHVGTFEPKKNLQFLLETYDRFRQIDRDNPTPVKLVLTGGESWKSSEIYQKITSSQYARDLIILGRVSVEDLPSLYRGATAFVFPSVFEGFGIPAIEALSQGTPVLVNANTALTQFKDFGAKVFEHFDAQIWAEELQTIVKNQQRVEPVYIHKVINYFDWDRTAKIIADALKI